MKPLVYITRRIPEEIIKPFEKDYEIEMWDSHEEPVDRELLLEKSRTADALVTMLSDKVDQELLERAEKLKIVANLAVGYDNIDVKEAVRKGVQLTNTPDVLTDTTADLVFGLLLATARRLVEAQRYVEEDRWKNWSPLLLAGTDVHHKTIGIVGMGRIGEAVAKRATGFDMNILYHNRSRKKGAEERLGAVYTPFDELLETSDYVVCMAPLTEDTEGMFDHQAFKKMKKEAVFINASRGQTVNEEDLLYALQSGEIQSAGLDVFQDEPISADHPLLQLDQVVALPHIGSATKETRYAMMELCLENVKLHLEGKEVQTPVSE
ncbi:D-glycerate dehydrogenase [Halobacillus litoralis]|uniref:2-hydroxyacid dehydrogenase n=1 Tax=Halobacillus litoralis TaxID=45668 RepID=UPI001CD49DF1|nr:D-glycerate dehydrogenase [Halobacillus litoralis]MCA0971775.1 D-glycerate dehydrogenase [Halobacillus litoralis]